jgi:FAD/FMN-containing dehydrogenase
LAVARPGSTDEVAAIVRACLPLGVAIVPQGGNTGQVAGGVPDRDGNTVVLSLSRMTRVRGIDPVNNTMTVEAGCILQAVQDAARASDRLFPLSLGAEGSCTIGGNLATNAGGTQVLRYGNARELTLGLEVVLADGEVWSALRGLRKDNSGYDLRDLFIGSEGTLGIITAATLRLFPLPRTRTTALAALPSIQAANDCLARCSDGFNASLTGFELISGACLRLVTATFLDQTAPFPALDSPWYALVERSTGEDDISARDLVESVLGGALEAGEVIDVAVAGSIAQADALWRLRESITLALAQDGSCLKHDISLPVSAIPEFVAAMEANLQRRYPGIRCFIFGHLGDGNLHFNVACRLANRDEITPTTQPEVSEIVHDAVHDLGGSISAEQGIGRVRLSELRRYKSPVELRLMSTIKRALDPKGLLNPGVLFPR